ncbi:MAG: nitroreductase family protein [Eubacteriales bacterium]
MEFLEFAKKRYSVRKFQDKPIEKEKLLQVIEAARIAPSAVNFQPWQFIIVQDEEVKEKLYETYQRDWIKSAPAIIVACGDHSKSWRRRDGKDHCDIDIAIAVDHMTLAAAQLGLGTCWVCAFNSARCHGLLDLPSNLEVIALLPIGYPEGEVNPNRYENKRAKLDDIVSWNEYRK